VARVIRREAAKRDLIVQWVWYAENGGVELADKFLTAVEATLDLLQLHPEIGFATACAKLELAGMRRFPAGESFDKILLFYLPCADGIDLVRVIHGSRDLPSLFED
jgi:toxin ParE1/3/4